MLEGIDYSVQVLQECDFEKSNLYEGLHGVTGDADITGYHVDELHGQSLKVDASGGGANIYPIMPSTAKGIVKLEYEARFENFFPMNLSLAVYDPGGGIRVDLAPLTLGATGVITTEDKRQVIQLEKDRWYKLCTYYNIEKKTFSFFVDDEALIFEQPFLNQSFEGISRIILAVSNGGVICLDNFNEYVLAKRYTVEASFYNADGVSTSSSAVSYDGTRIDLKFSENMTSSELRDNISVCNSDGAEVEYSGAYDSARRTYSISPVELSPNEKYTIVISDSLRSAVGGANGGLKEIPFKTAKIGFYLSGYKLDGGETLADLAGADKAIVDVDYINDTEEAVTGVIFFGIYKGNMLYSYDTASIRASAGQDGKKRLTAKLPSDAASGGYSIEIYLLDSMTQINVFDCLTDEENGTHDTSGSFIIEAEDMTPSGDMTVISDAAASGGKAIKVTASTWAGTIDQTSPQRSFYTEQTAQRSGNYAVWLRVKCINDGSNSVWGALNSSDYSLYEYSPSDGVYDEEYHWINLGYIMLQRGAFHVSFKYRELNFIADKLIITNDITFEPQGKDDVPDSENQLLYPEPEIKPIAQHPRLLVTEDMIPTLKSNMQSEELNQSYQSISQFSEIDLSGYIENAAGSRSGDVEIMIVARAMMYLIGEQDDEHAKQTIAYAREYLAGVSYDTSVQDITRKVGEAMMMGAVVYDWCYDMLTDDDKDFFVTRLKELAALKEIGYPPTKLSSIGSHGGEYEIMRDMLSVGIAVYDEDPEMYNLAAGRLFAEFVDSRKMFNKTGNHPQGTAYGSFRYECELWAALIFDRMGYKNIFGEEQSEVAYKWIYERLPFGAWFKDGDDTAITKYTYNQYSQFDIVAEILYGNMFGDPILKRQYLKEMSLINYIPITVWLPIIADPSIGIEEVNDLPLARKTNYPLSGIVARTSWQTGLDAPTAMAQMKIQEKNLGDHMHLDSGSFQIYYKGSLAVASGLYEGQDGVHNSSHYNNYYKRTISHNAVTVLDPNENVYPVPAGSSNDGGQKQVTSGVVKTYDALMNIEDLAQTKGSYIGPNEYTPKFSYIKGDITNAYSDKINAYNRSMVFMDLFDEDYPAAFVVFDRIDAANKDFKKTWLMHSMEEPAVEDNVTTICRTENGFNGKLVNKTMLPYEPEITKVEGFVVNGVEYPNREYDGINSEVAKWRIEVSPSQQNESDIFLNAMYVTDADRDLPALDMQMLQNGVMTGVAVKDRIVMFSDSAQPIDESFTLIVTDNGYEKISCLLTDMSEGIWRIIGGDTMMYAQSKQDEGCIYFEAEPGTYTVEKADGELTEFAAPRAEKNELGDFLIYYGGLFLNQPHPTKEISGTPYAALDGTAEYFNADVVWGADRQTATVTKSGRTYIISAGENSYTVNGQEKTTENAPVMIDGELYVPVIEYAAVFGLSANNMKYDSYAKILKI